jgi:hypothetical protein
MFWFLDPTPPEVQNPVSSKVDQTAALFRSLNSQEKGKFFLECFPTGLLPSLLIEALEIPSKEHRKGITTVLMENAEFRKHLVDLSPTVDFREMMRRLPREKWKSVILNIAPLFVQGELEDRVTSMSELESEEFVKNLLANPKTRSLLEEAFHRVEAKESTQEQGSPEKKRKLSADGEEDEKSG